jgi:acylglycerol lipase
LKDLASTPLPTVQASQPAETESHLEWIRASGGASLACRIWHGQPGQPVLLYLHGIEGHSQWFERTAQMLNDSGLTIYAPDRRGAGMNKVERGHLDSYKVFLADVDAMLRHIREQHPSEPIVLFGNCWGAKGAAVVAAHGYKGVDGNLDVQLSGLILTCPALFTKVDFDLKTKAGIAFDILRGAPHDRKQIDIPIHEAEWFTDNPVYIDFINNDPLRLKAATKRFYFENFLLSLKAASAAKRIQLPFLLVETDRDRIVNVDKVNGWYAKVASASKSRRSFTDASHSIDFDANWFGAYITLVLDWLKVLPVTAA